MKQYAGGPQYNSQYYEVQQQRGMIQPNSQYF